MSSYCTVFAGTPRARRTSFHSGRMGRDGGSLYCTLSRLIALEPAACCAGGEAKLGQLQLQLARGGQAQGQGLVFRLHSREAMLL